MPREPIGFRNAISYRVPMFVTEVLLLPSGGSYPVCPRCKLSLDREYVSFCDRCGQRLDWRTFAMATVRHAARLGNEISQR